MMSFNVRSLPKDLKEVLKKAGKNYGENLNQYLQVEGLEGQNAVKINYPFTLNHRMFDLDNDQAKSIGGLKQTNPEAFEKLAKRACIHLFGDNVSSYQKEFSNDKKEGSWLIQLDDFSFENGWMQASVYLVPSGFSLE